MRIFTRSCVVVALACAILLFGGRQLPAARAIVAAPAFGQPIFGTFDGGDLTITGTGFGAASLTSSLRFDYNGLTTIVAATSPAVHSWTDSAVSLTLPPEVHSGTLAVTVSGTRSAPADLSVLMYTGTALNPAGTAFASPLALALGADGTAWVNQEFHAELKALSPALPSVITTLPIPQSPGTGIFAQGVTGDSRVRFSELGEDIAVDDAGAVWFTEGGGYLYAGPNLNSSRIIKYEPVTHVFSCYNVPVDNAEVIGVLVDRARGMVWYTEGDLTYGNAISGFAIDSTPSDCSWSPDTDARPPLCSVAPVAGCHRRYVLPHPASAPGRMTLDPGGKIWFTEYWGNRIGRFDPDTGAFLELPLPRPIVQQGPGIYVGSGPFHLHFDVSGDLWFDETFDATISRLQPSLLGAADCTKLDAGGANPCIKEMFVASNGSDEATISMNAGIDGRIWFAVENGATRMGFIAALQGNAIVMLPSLAGPGNVGGIAQDPVSHDLWIAQYDAKVIGRIQLATGDGDGVPDSVDDCPNVYNPGQENHDGNVIDLHVYGKRFNDVTRPNYDMLGDACDSDADNDMLANTDELALGPGGASHALCPTASANTDPLKADTDGDRVLDGAECMLGTDPANAASFPPRIPAGDSDRDGLTDVFELKIGTNPFKADTDGDKLSDGLEFKYYGTDPRMVSSNGQICSDGRSVGSINGDLTVSSLDLFHIAVAINTGTMYVPDFDLNKDGAINVSDLALAASVFGYCDE